MDREKIIAFMKSKKVFTTSEASRNGITKKMLKSFDDLVCFGSFPVAQAKGARQENIWSYDSVLAELTKKARKLKRGTDLNAVATITKQIEELVAEKLGFDKAADQPDLPKPNLTTIEDKSNG